MESTDKSGPSSASKLSKDGTFLYPNTSWEPKNSGQNDGPKTPNSPAPEIIYQVDAKSLVEGLKWNDLILSVEQSPLCLDHLYSPLPASPAKKCESEVKEKSLDDHEELKQNVASTSKEPNTSQAVQNSKSEQIKDKRRPLEDSQDISSSSKASALPSTAQDKRNSKTSKKTSKKRASEYYITATSSSDDSKDKDSPKKKRYRVLPVGYDPNEIEDNVEKVKERLDIGCECDDNCLRHFRPEEVYKHRLNIAELTKAEHEMYLMGILMASACKPTLTNRQTARRRLRHNYMFQGRRVCLESFVYLENCTLYQLKMMRKHLAVRGVIPRVHGNSKRCPANALGVEHYRHVQDFLKEYLKAYLGTNDELEKLTRYVHLPKSVSKKSVYLALVDHGRRMGLKSMSMSSFGLFLKKRFPFLRFHTADPFKLNEEDRQLAMDLVNYAGGRPAEEEPGPGAGGRRGPVIDRIQQFANRGYSGQNWNPEVVLSYEESAAALNGLEEVHPRSGDNNGEAEVSFESAVALGDDQQPVSFDGFVFGNNGKENEYQLINKGFVERDGKKVLNLVVEKNCYTDL